MSLAGGIVVFGVMWWLVLFMVLPFGVTSQHEAEGAEEGTDPGAPIAPKLVRKMLITTGITIVLWGLLYMAIANQWITLDNMPGFDPRVPRDS